MLKDIYVLDVITERNIMRTIPEMLFNDVCDSTVANYEGDSHHEICHNVYMGLSWYKKIFYLTTQGRSYLDSVIDECVTTRQDDYR